MEEIIFNQYVVCPYCNEIQQIIDGDQTEYVCPNSEENEESEEECMFCDKMFYCRRTVAHLTSKSSFEDEEPGK